MASSLSMPGWMSLQELRNQCRMSAPLITMNLMWFARIMISFAFLGRQGELRLAGGTLGFTIANVTGFSVLNGLCSAMETVCGQAHGAKNIRLLHKTLVMATSLLLLTSLPIAVMWLNVDKILDLFGQHEDISGVAKTYLFYMLPNLVVTSILSPIKGYLNAQNKVIPIMLSSTLGVACHVPINILLSKSKGLEGISMAVWISDLVMLIPLVIYLLITEYRNQDSWTEGGWWDQGLGDWRNFLKLAGPCCLTTCLEWWCYEILVLLTGRLQNATQAVGVIAVVFNFDYLLYSFHISIATTASIRVSNELGANQPQVAYHSARLSLIVSAVLGCIAGSLTVAARGVWGRLFSHDHGIIKGAKKAMLLLALVEVVNFPLAVCGGIIRGTARPWISLYSNLSAFYLLALPLGVILAFKLHLGLMGLLIGFVAGPLACLILLLVSIARINWVEEAGKAQRRTSSIQETANEDGDHENPRIED